MQKMIIGVSRLSPNYENWLKKLAEGAEIIDLYELPADEASEVVISSSGILLTGGSDIHPASYGRAEDLPYCRNIDVKRDKLELTVIDLVFLHKIPVLGICRGQQILNVARQGTLYSDIPAFFNSHILHSDKEDVFHRVDIRENTLLHRITGVKTGIVNSAHHQSLNIVAPDFFVSACSPDNLAEAIELKHGIEHPFCLAVQWHPERMNMEDPLSGKLGAGFVEAARRSRE